MVEFDDGSTFNIARKQLSLAPSDVEPKAARKRKIAAEDTTAEETTERRASKPRAARNCKTAAKDAAQASSATQPTQATPQAAASKKRKAAPVAALKTTTPAAKKTKTTPPPAASQVTRLLRNTPSLTRTRTESYNCLNRWHHPAKAVPSTPAFTKITAIAIRSTRPTPGSRKSG